jgi:hypothetical protein
MACRAIYTVARTVPHANLAADSSFGRPSRRALLDRGRQGSPVSWVATAWQSINDQTCAMRPARNR